MVFCFSEACKILLGGCQEILRLKQKSVSLRLGQSCLYKELCKVWKSYDGESFGYESQRIRSLEGNAQGVPEDKLALSVLSVST